jgi:hypothetical protein
MGDMMVLDITTDTGRKIKVINIYDQLEKGRTGNLRSIREVNWQQVMTEKTIMCGDFNSYSYRWDANCTQERDSRYWKEWQDEYLMQLENDGQPTRTGSNGDGSVIDFTWTTPFESPLAKWRMGTDCEETGSDHRLVVWETKQNSNENLARVRDQIRWDITSMTNDEKDGARLLWLQIGENRPTLTNMSFCEVIESEAIWIQETLTYILNQKARRVRICARSKRWWNETIEAKRKAVGRAKRTRYQNGGADRLRAVRKDLKTEIRKAKRKTWQDFLTNAKRDERWNSQNQQRQLQYQH